MLEIQDGREDKNKSLGIIYKEEIASLEQIF